MTDAAAIAAELAALISEQQQAATQPLLDASEAARLLNVPTSWLRAEERAGRVPAVRLGRYVRFDREELLTWLDGRRVGPRSPNRP